MLISEGHFRQFRFGMLNMWSWKRQNQEATKLRSKSKTMFKIHQTRLAVLRFKSAPGVVDCLYICNKYGKNIRSI